ncbi:MAG: hypothetical protein IRY99_04785 [Isosphaeraceae bacterium]|nr:hypothetical protein [Isosphaeraceae bacterium]
MVACAYCEQPLICEGCNAEYRPAGPEDYSALSWSEQPILCPACGAPLICKWCKTPYDGRPLDEESEGIE